MWYLIVSIPDLCPLSYIDYLSAQCLIGVDMCVIAFVKFDQGFRRYGVDTTSVYEIIGLPYNEGL